MTVRLISFYGFVVVLIFSLMGSALLRLIAAHLTTRNADSALGQALGALI